MSINRRNFINKLVGFSGAMSVLPFFQTASGQALAEQLAHLEYRDLTDQEDFWQLVRQAYTTSPTLINLNNGGVCPQPKVVQEALERYNRFANEAPSYYMWRVIDKGREPLRRRLADLGGCDPEEIAINRNATESLETVIFGLQLQAGDEVVLSKYDYPNMINAWKQREHRDGIVLKWVDLTFPMELEAEVVQRYQEQVTPRTRILHLTHLINWTGQVLPVAKIAAMGRRFGLDILVDGAHTFAHLDFAIPDLNCDYFGTSLHKWLCAPFGTGMLYVRKEKIAGVYPLFAAPEPGSDDIRKFEHLGTRSFATEQAIATAVDFHAMIGSERKRKRLHFLKNYWLEKVLELPGVHSFTSLEPEYSGAIACVSIQDRKPSEVSSYLFNQHGIHTVGIEWEAVAGIRVTPNVYTTRSELDRLVEALTDYCS